jgi:hypothetical protein
VEGNNNMGHRVWSCDKDQGYILYIFRLIRDVAECGMEMNFGKAAYRSGVLILNA